MKNRLSIQRNKVKILLLQIREDLTVKEEELQSFSKYSGIPLDQISTYNVFDEPNFNEKILVGHNILFVGGASEASVLNPKRYPFIESIKTVLNHALDINLPVFASCFGFQAAVLALGGKIIRDENEFEMGTYPISLTQIAKTDPVYKNTPNGFYAVSVHQEKALDLPESCELLAYTESCCHSFKVKNKPFWAFQFHPELDKECLTQRLGIYQEKYTEDKEHFENIIKSIKNTDESNLLVKHFIDYFVSN